MKKLRNVADVIAFVLAIGCVIVSGIDHNYQSMTGWLCTVIWIIRCKIAEYFIGS